MSKKMAGKSTKIRGKCLKNEQKESRKIDGNGEKLSKKGKSNKQKKTK